MGQSSLVRKLLLGAAGAAVGLLALAAFSTYIDEREQVQGGAFVSVTIGFLFPLLSPVLHLKDVIGSAFPELEASAALFGIRTFLLPPIERVSIVPPPPNYENETYAWSALPHVVDSVDMLPPHCGTAPCSKEGQAGAQVDLFYVGPSTFYSPSYWNAEWDSSTVRYLSQEAILVQQAMPFNGAARIFSPNIRQMSGFCYFADGPENSAARVKAADLAYSDVRSAFEHYLKHWAGSSKGFILAGHSQGAEYMLRLVRDVVSRDPALKAKLVAVYAVGMPVYQEHLDEWKIPVCRTPTDVGCVISWQSYQEGANPDLFVFEPSDPGLRRNGRALTRVCVNPLSWRADTTHVPASENLGAMHIVQWYQNFVFLTGTAKGDTLNDRRNERVNTALLPLKPHLAGARCGEQGALFVDPLPRYEFGSSPVYTFFPAWRFSWFPAMNLHPLDFNLFWANVRSNAETRVAAFLSARR